jgi:hypothetical protein
MDFARQRLLQAVVPVVAFAVTVPLAAAGVGVVSLVIGPAVGNLAGIAAALAASPYRLALRYDRAVARRYLRFSVPSSSPSSPALVVAAGPDPRLRRRSRPGVGRLRHARDDAVALHRSRRHDRDVDDLPRHLRHPRADARARGALRPLQPRDAAVGGARVRGRPCSSPTT